MAPWMIIGAIALVGLGLLVLAPRMHRRSLERAGLRADSARQARVREMQERAPVTTVVIADPAQANSIQRQLLLRGVRSHVVDSDGRTELVFESRYEDLVAEVRRETGNL